MMLVSIATKKHLRQLQSAENLSYGYFCDWKVTFSKMTAKLGKVLFTFETATL